MCASFFFCNSFWGKNRDCMLFAICILHTKKKNVREMLILTSKLLCSHVFCIACMCLAFSIVHLRLKVLFSSVFVIPVFCSILAATFAVQSNSISRHWTMEFLILNGLRISVCVWVCIGERDGTLGVWLWITTMESRLWLRGASCGIHQRLPTSLSSRCVNVLLLVLHWISYEKLLQNLVANLVGNLCIKSCCTLTHQ